MQSSSSELAPTAHSPSIVLSDREPLAVDAAAMVSANAVDRSLASYPRDATLPELFESQAARRPNGIALIDGEQQFTYAELNGRANRLANYLRARGVCDGDIVGMYLPRGADSIVTILAILKAGGAYLPLDTADPSSRVLDILQDARAVTVVSSGRLLRRIAAGVTPGIALDEIVPQLANASAENPARTSGPLSVCYVMFTSGSTGRPKGVIVHHRGVVRLVCGTDYLDFGQDRVFLQLAPLCFDASTFEIWGALLHGGRLVLAPDGTPDPERLAALMQQHRVCTLWLTASLFNTLVDVCPRIFEGLEQLIVGGEALSPAHVRRVDRLLKPNARIVNGYGPTEGTTFSCCYNIPRPVGADIQAIPIGRAVAQTRVYVLDEELRPVAKGNVGELCIGGDGLAEGYLNAPELTAKKFIQASSQGEIRERIYRTGDRVRQTTDGNLEFLGRIDQQIKIRGNRVETAEIEWALCQHAAVAQCVVSAVAEGSTENVLVAHFVSRDAAVTTTSNLRAHLRTLLPEYMLPTAFIPMSEFPLNTNGKVDRSRLPRLPRTALSGDSGHSGMRSADECELAKLWADVLGKTRIGRHDHFIFDLAGSSLLALQLIDRVNRCYGVRLSIPDILSTPTVATMCEKIVGRPKRASSKVRYLEVVRPGEGHVTVVCVGFANPLPLLQQALPGGVPLWWLKLEGFHALPHAIRPIPETAASYAAELSQTAARDFVLVGHSYCGLIALELARQLRDAGHRIRTLVLEPPLAEMFQDEEPTPSLPNDTTSTVPKLKQNASPAARELPTSSYFRAPLQRMGKGMRRRYRKWLLRPALKFYAKSGGQLPARYRQWWYYYPEMRRRILSFRVDRRSGPVLLAGQPAYLDSCLATWQALLDGPVEVCALPTATQHTDLMSQPAAAEWLAVVTRWAQP